MEIVYDIQKLTKCIVNEDLESNQKIAVELFKTLVKHPTGTKLACNQIGITNHRVAVVNIREPLYLVNPEVVVNAIPITYVSDDLSFPQKLVKTQKFARIVVKADNFKKPITFGVKTSQTSLNITNPVIMEACAIQHVVDLLNGITMYDREKRAEQVIADKKYQRNEIITLEKELEDSIQIKFKHASKYLSEGWKIKS